MDKNSIKYFMTQMTQEEFSELIKGMKINNYKFNRIQPERSKREEQNTYPSDHIWCGCPDCKECKCCVCGALNT